eukprot:11246246-Alexandrium_andersonii.AAC.1
MHTDRTPRSPLVSSHLRACRVLGLSASSMVKSHLHTVDQSVAALSPRHVGPRLWISRRPPQRGSSQQLCASLHAPLRLSSSLRVSVRLCASQHVSLRHSSSLRVSVRLRLCASLRVFARLCAPAS